jgi:hypothetical protein
MLALVAKIVWMNAIGVSAGPALIIIPMLLGAIVAAFPTVERPKALVRRMDAPPGL